jgi:hypothetical protein
VLGRPVGVKDGAVFVSQQHSTAESIEGFGHPRALDRTDIEHFADRHRPAQMRQQQLSKLNLVLRDDALPFVPTAAEAGQMYWRALQEEHHPVHHPERLCPLVKMRRCFEIRGSNVARDHVWLVQRAPGLERPA